MTPEQILHEHIGRLVTCGMSIDADEMIAALDAAGYVIVPKEAVDALARGEIDLVRRLLAKP